jgi:hypothetical protein
MIYMYSPDKVQSRFFYASCMRSILFRFSVYKYSHGTMTALTRNHSAWRFLGLETGYCLSTATILQTWRSWGLPALAQNLKADIVTEIQVTSSGLDWQRKSTVSNASKMAKLNTKLLLLLRIKHAQVCSNFTKAFFECYFVVLMVSPLLCIEEKPLGVCYREPYSITLPTILCNPRELCSGNVLEFCSINMRLDSQSGYRLYWLFCGSGVWVTTLPVARLVTDELESFWKEAVWLGAILPFAWRRWGKQRKTSVRITGVSAEIRTEHFPNTNAKHYR